MALGNKGQGVVWSWITALIGMGFVISVYIVFDQVIYQEMLPAFDSVYNITAQNSGTLNTLNTMWDLWAVVFVAGWMLYGIMQSMRREPNTGYQ